MPLYIPLYTQLVKQCTSLGIGYHTNESQYGFISHLILMFNLNSGLIRLNRYQVQRLLYIYKCLPLTNNSNFNTNTNNYNYNTNQYYQQQLNQLNRLNTSEQTTIQ